MKHYVYWVHSEEETDMFTEGYIGITNNIKGRLSKHKNKGSIREILLVGSLHYCREIEYKLRPTPGIGLNIAQGGGGGGFRNHIHKEESKQKTSQKLKGRSSWNKDKKMGKQSFYHRANREHLFFKSGEENIAKDPNIRIKISKAHQALADSFTSEERKIKYGDHNKGRPSWNKGIKTGPNGYYWITNGIESMKIKETEPIPEGFQKGRKIKKEPHEGGSFSSPV